MKKSIGTVIIIIITIAILSNLTSNAVRAEDVVNGWEYVKEALNEVVIKEEHMDKMDETEWFEYLEKNIAAHLNANREQDMIYFRIDEIREVDNENGQGGLSTSVSNQLLAMTSAFSRAQKTILEEGKEFEFGVGFQNMQGIKGKYQIKEEFIMEIPKEIHYKDSNIGVFGDLRVLEVIITQLNSKTGKEIEQGSLYILEGTNIDLRPIYIMQEEYVIYYYTEEGLIEKCKNPFFDDENGIIKEQDSVIY